FSTARLEPAPAGQPASFAPPQPCSAPPGSTAIVRAEKEETSPGLGHSRSRHDPLAALQLSDKDLELLAEFALDLSFGGSSEGWIEPTRTAVVRLCQAVAAGGAAYANLEQAMRALAEELALTQKINEENRPRLYGLLLTVDLALGKRLDLAAQKALRERLIVDQLLEELALTQPVITRRLREQGLASLDVLMRMPGEELAGKLESPLDQAEQIVTIFRNYGSQRSQRGAECALGGKSFAVRQRLIALEAAAEAFDRASEGEDSSARRRTRRQRQMDAAQLGLQLAEFGEAKLLGELDRCSVQAKIQRVQRWLAERASTPPSAGTAPAERS
ncbi:MAG TPA: hypothetical protein VG963_14695, partial [Polyangiaceae bacterium]|nr:hypothetical protein [Polyangiaceae bacterium]